jgi:hypothetical protein
MVQALYKRAVPRRLLLQHGKEGSYITVIERANSHTTTPHRNSGLMHCARIDRTPGSLTRRLMQAPGLDPLVGGLMHHRSRAWPAYKCAASATVITPSFHSDSAWATRSVCATVDTYDDSASPLSSAALHAHPHRDLCCMAPGRPCSDTLLVTCH